MRSVIALCRFSFRTRSPLPGEKLSSKRLEANGSPTVAHVVQRRGGHLFDDFERLSVENPDFVERMDLVVRCQHCPVSDEAYPFNLSGTAAEIRFCLGDDNVGVEPLRGYFSLNQLLEWIATNEVDGRNRRNPDAAKAARG